MNHLSTVIIYSYVSIMLRTVVDGTCAHFHSVFDFANYLNEPGSDVEAPTVP